MPAVVYTFRLGRDGQGAFAYVSAACADLYGFTADEAMADAALLHDAIHPGHRVDFDDAGQRSLRSMTDLCWEGPIVHRDGTIRQVVINSQPRRLPDGSTQWHGVVVARSHREGDLGEEASELRDALHMLGHDFGAPLTVILGYAEWAQEVLQSSQQDSSRTAAQVRVFERSLEVIVRQAKRLDGMRNDLAALSVAERHVGDVDSEPRRVLPHLLAAADLVRSPLECEVRCSDDLACTVTSSHLDQMLNNLVANATRFALGRIVLTASTSGGRVRIAVEDDGPGVRPEVAARLFVRFTHAASPAASSAGSGETGTGLGLYIVRTLARTNRGTVVYDRSATGARFTIALPIA